MLFCAFATIVHLFLLQLLRQGVRRCLVDVSNEVNFCYNSTFFSRRYMARPMVNHCCYNQIDFVTLVLSWMQK
jgi:hypothetical protein